MATQGSGDDVSPLFEPYSVREQVERPSLFVLDPIPTRFRAQLIHILRRLLGTQVRQTGFKGVKQPSDFWIELAEQVAEALGRVALRGDQGQRAYALTTFIASDKYASTADVIDTIEVILHTCRGWQNSVHRSEQSVADRLDQAILEMNQRFRQHHLGYRIQNDQIIRVDSQYVHREITEQAFRLLDAEDFQGAMDEFEAAHKHYLDDEPRQAIGSAHSAFESALKTICDRNGWKYDRDRDGAKRLIDVVIRENQLLPALLQPSFKKLIEVLEFGLPQLANRRGRHGQGSLPHVPEGYLVAYALHLTAANIVLLIEAFRSWNLSND